MTQSAFDEELFISLLLDYGKFNKRFSAFAKEQAKKFGWHRNRINYHVRNWEKAQKSV